MVESLSCGSAGVLLSAAGGKRKKEDRTAISSALGLEGREEDGKTEGDIGFINSKGDGHDRVWQDPSF